MCSPRTSGLAPSCPGTFQLLSFCHVERIRDISLNLQELVLRPLDYARGDRMIESESFSDKLPRGNCTSISARPG